MCPSSPTVLPINGRARSAEKRWGDAAPTPADSSMRFAVSTATAITRDCPASKPLMPDVWVWSVDGLVGEVRSVVRDD